MLLPAFSLMFTVEVKPAGPLGLGSPSSGESSNLCVWSLKKQERWPETDACKQLGVLGKEGERKERHLLFVFSNQICRQRLSSGMVGTS